MEKLRRNKGITLVALVITTIILLILAVISIQAISNTGLFNMTDEARKKFYNGQKEENNILASYEEKIDEIVGSRDTVTISKEEYETLKNSNSYSETEMEIGTWIDGRKLYRVTIHKTMKMNGIDWYAFNLGLSKYNIKQLVNVDYCSIYNTKDLKSGAVYSFLMSFISGDILNVYLSTNDEIIPDSVILTYTKLDS